MLMSELSSLASSPPLPGAVVVASSASPSVSSLAMLSFSLTAGPFNRYEKVFNIFPGMSSQLSHESLPSQL